MNGPADVQTLESQFLAFLDGRLHEVARDWYGQADDGSVWYFGEDVFNYDEGILADTGGTWLAGKDGPVAMIMPANPEVGNVYRPENIPGLVFEEVTIKTVGLTVEGPYGPVNGAIVAQERHLEGEIEEKNLRSRLRRVLERLPTPLASRRSHWPYPPTPAAGENLRRSRRSPRVRIVPTSWRWPETGSAPGR